MGRKRTAAAGRTTRTPARPPTRRGAAPPAPAATEPAPLTRWMSVIAQDPTVRVSKDGPILMARIAVPAERLAPGPIGYRLQVVDYDASTRRYAGAHVLPAAEDPEPAAWRAGRASIVEDPVFRAHNTYAIAMKTLARFEFALGRRVGWGFRNHQLKIAPTGMVDANAFYSREDEGLVFGYFRGATGPRNVYTCLSHDVVAHETTHALLDGLRERYLLPSTPDQAAFHEGFADVVALLSVYGQREIVRHLLRAIADADGAIPLAKITAEALRETALFRLADQLGEEISGIRGEPLRASAKLEPRRGLLAFDEFLEPHRRGEVFVAAVLRAFLAVWVGRVLRTVVPGQRRVSLVQVAEEGADIADALVTMWIRALDYLPPSDVSFGDALSAALTADFELRPDDDRFRLRAHVRDAFRAYGIAPTSPRTVPEPGLWPPPPADLSYDRVRFESLRTDEDEVFRFLWENRDADRLALESVAYTDVLTVAPCVRVGIDGFTLRETVATYYQVARLTVDELRERRIEVPPSMAEAVDALRAQRAAARGDADAAEDEDGEGEPQFAVYGGGTLIFDESGRLKYWIRSEVFGARQSERLAYLWETGALTVDPKGTRVASLELSALHRLRTMDTQRTRRREW